MDNDVAGYRFRDERLLQAALTHTSYLPEAAEPPIESFERLEFLGDGVVDFVVADDLFRKFPDAAEGELTERRAQVVSRVALARVGDQLGLMERARLGKGVGVNEPRYGFTTRLFESVVGAVYIDGGFEAARSFVRSTLGPLLEQPLRRSPKGELQELTQDRFGAMPEYVKLESADVDQPPRFVYEARIAGKAATGAGRSMKAAQEQAAARLLEELKRDE
ncbi:MAG: ribonuclease III [Chloroflexota bacterium]|nr:ribonuclease III [Chloroflexota bacterium]MDE3192219.1 ribonuclease III [Chloroflexota bacterium]